MVRCKMCFVIKGRDNFLMPKLDLWVKHYKLEKCTIPKLEVVTRFMCVVLMHL